MTFNASLYPTKEHVVFHGGQTIAIGRDDCIAKFDKQPSIYLNDTATSSHPSRGELLTCPVSGETFIAPADDLAHFVQFHHGQSVYTCCPHCARKMLANLTQFILKLPLPSGIAQ